ncbi:MAG: sulfite exporter TauE/SafE family protein [Promethearchaeota archaeon]
MELSLELILILIFLGLLFGALATMAGVGGGVFYVPALVLLLALPIKEAIDTSSFVILITSGIGFISYLKQKRTNLKLSLIFAIFSIMGALLCAFMLLFVVVENTVLRLLFGILLIFTGINMFHKINRGRKKSQKNPKNLVESYSLAEHDYKKDLKKGGPFFMFAGFISYLLGIGGGVINTPSLNLIFNFPIHNATAISTSIIFFTSIFNTISKIFLGQINYIIGAFLAIGSIIGALIGAKYSAKIPKLYLQFIVAILLIGVGINMLI